MSSLTRLKRTALAATLAGATACASAATTPREQEAPPPSPAAPLAVMAGRPVLVLPVQYVTFSDSLSRSLQLPLADQYLAALDDSIATALGDRGLRSWTFARAITASARRNAGMTADPHAVAAERLRRLVRAGDDPLSEPLASQIRSLVALGDARYVVLPAMLRLDNRVAGARGSLLVYLIDARTSRIQWSGEVSGEGTTSVSQALGRVARHFADLVVAR